MTLNTIDVVVIGTETKLFVFHHCDCTSSWEDMVCLDSFRFSLRDQSEIYIGGVIRFCNSPAIFSSMRCDIQMHIPQLDELFF